MTSKSDKVDLLIIGAGPAGLMAACWATQYDISTRIIDQKEGRTPTGHADGIQTRTLEILDSFGLASRVIKEGVTAAEECYWTPNKRTGNIERLGREESSAGQEMRFGKALLNQGAVEQVLLDYLGERGQISVELNKKAENLNLEYAYEDGQDTDSRVVVEVRDTSGLSGRMETIHTRYLIACDGAHSWTRNQLDVLVEGTSEESTWGVLDIVPITDFPDIRQSCAIQSRTHGCIMTIPRENGLVRFYVYLNGDTEEGTIRSSKQPTQELGRCIERAMKPYRLSFRHCDWWSLYKVRRQLVGSFRPQNRVFLVGDAAHTHSPLGGQGMNVSIQDAYNLMWKLGGVITGSISSAILDTYHYERSPVAKELMRLDSELVRAYQEESSNWNNLFKTLGKHAGFMSGIDVTYSPSILTSTGYQGGCNKATNIRLGMRIPSFPVVYQCDGTRIHLAQALVSNGLWRILVFPGDLRQPKRVDILKAFAHWFCQSSLNAGGPGIEPIVIHSSPRIAVDYLNLPRVLQPCHSTWMGDCGKIFADESAHNESLGPLHQGYGIDAGPGFVILCRPDQHISWAGNIADLSGLKDFLYRLR